MKPTTNKKTKGKPGDALYTSIFVFTVCSALCFFMLAFFCADGEKYNKEESVPAAITYTPPAPPAEEGFWDIFAETVVRLFIPEV